MSKLTEYEEAMETICDECQTRYLMPVEGNYCLCNCMVRRVWRDILAEQKKEREGKSMELTTVENLMEQLKSLNPNTPVYVLGCQGYLHITEDDNGNQAITFDDNEEI